MASAVVLAGGRSSRMGKDKALIEVKGKPMITRVLEAALEVCREVVVVTGGWDRPTRLMSFLLPGTRLLHDLESLGKPSPLVGLVTGLLSVKSDYCLALEVDSPFLSVRALRYLASKARGTDGAVPVNPNGSWEVLHSCYDVDKALRAGLEALREGNSSILSMVRRMQEVIFITPKELRNYDPTLRTIARVNTPEDLAMLGI